MPTRMTKHLVETLESELLSYLRSHACFKQLETDLAHAAMAAYLVHDRPAAELASLVKTIPRIVKDQLPTRDQVQLYWSGEHLKKEFLEGAQRVGLLVDPQIVPTYIHENVGLPKGEVLYTASSIQISFNKDRDESIHAWYGVFLALHRRNRGKASIETAVNHVAQLAYEVRYFEKLYELVPILKVALKPTWFEAPEELKPAAPAQNLLDPETAARLRAIVLGDAA